MQKLISQVLGGTVIGLALLLGASGAASGSVTTQITKTKGPYDDWDPAISGSNVVWCGRDGASDDYEIYFWGGSLPIQPIQVTDNNIYV